MLDTDRAENWNIGFMQRISLQILTYLFLQTHKNKAHYNQKMADALMGKHFKLTKHLVVHNKKKYIKFLPLNLLAEINVKQQL